MEEELSRIPAGGGPHIVAIGGGTGLSTMLRGLACRLPGTCATAWRLWQMWSRSWKSC